MLRRIRNKFRRNRRNTESEANTQPNVLEPVIVNEDTILINKEGLEQSLPYIEEIANEDKQLIPKREVTNMSWTGPILAIQGYYYLQNIPISDEDLVKKRLILIGNSGNKIVLPLKDISVKHLGLNIEEKYEWAGFEGEYNFATIMPNGHPLVNDEYKVMIDIEVHVPGERYYHKMYTVGNIEKFLSHGFHSTKMEHFTATRELKYNLLINYDQAYKTLKIVSTKLKDFNPKEFALNNQKENTGIVQRFMRTVGFKLLYYFYHLVPVKQKKVLFASDSRDDISGNFAFVYEDMLKRNLDLDVHFILKKGVDAKKTFKEINRLAYDMATAKIILLDDFYPMVYPLRIRKNAELIQLWHAVGAFKTFGFSRIGRPGGPSPKSINHRNYTKAIVSSKNVAKYYAEGFGITEDKIIATGIPRTDIFFDEQYKSEVRERLYSEYPFLKEKKVITFAPTFRGNGQQSAHYPMEVLQLENLYNELKDEYVFLFKIHPFVKNDFNIPYQYKDFFYDFSDYREINDLLFVTDILITDYSSVCFEFALLNKPMLFFAYDIEEYVNKRDFYYEYNSFIPGPLVRSTEEIIEKIVEKDFKMEKIKPFAQYYFDDHDGRSSQRVVEQLILGIDETENE